LSGGFDVLFITQVPINGSLVLFPVGVLSEVDRTMSIMNSRLDVFFDNLTDIE